VLLLDDDATANKQYVQQSKQILKD